MFGNLKKWWIRKRYRKKKVIEITPDTQGLAYDKPLLIKSGDEEKTGAGAVEISFENIHDRTDIYSSITPVEREKLDLEEESAVFWYNAAELVEEEKFTLYYGRKHRWAVLFDSLFMQEETGYNENMVMVQHLKPEPI